MSEDILHRLLDMMVEMKVKVDKIDGLETSVKRLASTVGQHGEILTGMSSDISQLKDGLRRVETKVDKLDARLDNVESEFETVMDAVMDVGRSVKDHDLAIKEIRARYN